MKPEKNKEVFSTIILGEGPNFILTPLRGQGLGLFEAVISQKKLHPLLSLSSSETPAGKHGASVYHGGDDCILNIVLMAC